jgi:hypothetical protein
MFATRHLIFATALAFQAAALPAADPIDEPKECWTSSDDYWSSSWQYDGAATELVSTEEWVWTSVDSDVPLTTLCDGKARALEPYKTAVITETETLETPTLTTFTRAYTEPSPTCTIGESACSSLVYTHDLIPRYCTLSPTYPPCTATSASCYIEDDGHSTLVSGNPRLSTLSVRGLTKTKFYWPVSTLSGDFCAQNGSTVFASQTSPPQANTAAVDGFTFTSPTNYISFDAISADIITKIGRSRYRRQCGGPSTEHVVVPLTAPLYSGGNAINYGSATYSFNFADLNTAPAEAYSRQDKCGLLGEPESCSGVFAYQAAYTPIVIMPDLTHLDPKWKAAGCKGFDSAWSIPHVALATPTPT